MLCISSKHCNTQMGTLVDRGAIAGIAVEDVCIFDKNRMQLMYKEISNNQINNIPNLTVGDVILKSLQ